MRFRVFCLFVLCFLGVPAARSENESSAPNSGSLVKGADSPAAIAEIRAAAEKSDAQSQLKLGRLNALGQGMPVNDSEALNWFRKAAEQGLAEAELSMGHMYAYSMGVPKDYEQAFKWYQKAANQELPTAQFEIARAYSLGRGVNVNHEEALNWFRKAAEQGLARAQFELGYMYGTGLGAPKDEAESMKWYRKSAERGFPEAQLLLGGRYSKGEGVAQNDVEATRWYKKAAEQGNPDAQMLVGNAYGAGRGVPKSPAEAHKWHRRAAGQGQGSSQLTLAADYAAGKIVKRDLVEAYKWCLLAMRVHEEKARKLLVPLESALTKKQQLEGQKLAREFKAKSENAIVAALEVAAATPQPAPTQAIPISRRFSGPAPKILGAGFFITNDGYFVSHELIAPEGARVRVSTAKGLMTARVAKVDEANNLSLLKVEGEFTALPVTPSRSVRIGSQAQTMAFSDTRSEGFSAKLTNGEIEGLSGVKDDVRHFKVRSAPQSGNAGGALMDDRGNVIGVFLGNRDKKLALLTSGSSDSETSYAIKSSYLLSFLEAVPDVGSQLKEPIKENRQAEAIATDAEQALVLLLAN